MCSPVTHCPPPSPRGPLTLYSPAVLAAPAGSCTEMRRMEPTSSSTRVIRTGDRGGAQAAIPAPPHRVRLLSISMTGNTRTTAPNLPLSHRLQPALTAAQSGDPSTLRAHVAAPARPRSRITQGGALQATPTATLSARTSVPPPTSLFPRTSATTDTPFGVACTEELQRDGPAPSIACW